MSLRHFLREATQPLHARLDQLLTPSAFESSTRYGHFLAAQAAALIPLELALEATDVISLLPDWSARRRRQALLADLDALDETAQPLPQPAFRMDAARWGALYVLEGSRLGAAMLLRQLGEVGDARMLAATRYLRHGAGSRLWPDFLQRLAQVDSGEQPHVLAGAEVAFGLFIAAAQRYPASPVSATG